MMDSLRTCRRSLGHTSDTRTQVPKCYIWPPTLAEGLSTLECDRECRAGVPGARVPPPLACARLRAMDPPSASLPHAFCRCYSPCHVGLGMPGAPVLHPIAAQSRPTRARQPRPRQCHRPSSTIIGDLFGALSRIIRRRLTSGAAAHAVDLREHSPK